MNNTLLELMQIGSEKNYELHLKIVEEQHNIISVNSDDKIIDIEIGLPEHKDLPTLINDAVKKVV